MYGVVNKAIEDLVVCTYGEDKWAAIKAQAGVDIEVFISNEAYADDISYRLIGATSRVLDLPVRDILIAFGEHWVLQTGVEHYGALLRSGGGLKEFLLNLPHFHTRVQLFYPKLQPPEFACTHVEDNALRLHYYTHRPGLADFVVGLVQGLGKLYDTPACARLIESREEGFDHDVFLVTWAAAGA